MRFLADMGVSRLVVEWLRQSGHDAIHLRERGLHRMKDPEILAKAREEQRVLLTMDLDFGYLLAVSGWNTPSTVIFRLEDETAESVIGRLKEVLKTCREVIGEGALLSVRGDSIRVRRLPIR